LCLLFVAGCSKGEEAGQPASGTATPVTGADGLAIGFRSEPDPPHSGENDFEVTVNGPDGAPVTDATVTVVFSMPAMPSMNMPAMKSETTLAHEAGGRYRGAGELEMGGTWNVSVTVSRGAEEIGNRKLSIVTK
jgi:nitrogen fixation protein FixH